MKSADITPEQARKVGAWLGPTTLQLSRLHERMQARQFPANDPLPIDAAAAYDAVRKLRLKIHELERRSGTDRPPAWVTARDT